MLREYITQKKSLQGIQYTIEKKNDTRSIQCYDYSNKKETGKLLYFGDRKNRLIKMIKSQSCKQDI